jgi:5'(3')-deoxyribonucleotidase
MCDIDGILNDLTAKALMLYNSRNNKNIHLSDITAYSFSECLPREDADGICELFKDKELWDSLDPLPGSQKGLRTLINNGHNVYLATATLPENFQWKIEWLKKYFSFLCADNVIRITNKGLLKCDVMIDDCIDNLTSNLCERVVLDAPWNRNKTKDTVYDIKRAHNWNEIVKIINDLERKNKEWEK